MNEKLINHLTISVDVLYLFLILFSYLGLLSKFWNMFYIFYFVLIINTVWLTFKIKNIPEEKRENNSMFYIFEHLFLLTLIIFTINQFLKKQIIIDFMSYLIGLSIAFGFLTFYAFRNKMEKENELEKNDENFAEIKRYQEFDEKFPRINNIPLFRLIIRRAYGEGWGYSLALIGVLLIFLFFGMHHLGQFMSVDEPKWVDVRVPQLFDALKNGNWDQTCINDKPGILPAFLSGAVNLFLNHNYYKANPLIYEDYLFWWRLPILLFNSIMLVFLYILSKKLFNKELSLIFILLISLNPIILGISQIVNPDSTLWSTVIITILCFFIFLKTEKRKFLYFSGIFFGLALLSKYFASILYIFFFFVLVLEYILREDFDIKLLSNRCIDLLILFSISIIIYTIFFPYTWNNPLQIYYGTLGSEILSPGVKFILPLIALFFGLVFIKSNIKKYILNSKLIKILFRVIAMVLFLIFFGIILSSLFKFSFFDFNDFMFNYTKSLDFPLEKIIQASFIITILTLTWPILIGIMVSFFILSVNKFKFDNKLYPLILMSILTFILLFILGSSIGRYVTITRYQIILYPLYALFALFPLTLISSKKILRIIIGVLIIIGLLTIISSLPFYLLYNNSLNTQNLVVSEPWGFGGYELAKIMNKLPDSENITVWSDREGFNEFFVGKSYWRGIDNPYELQKIDYLILSYGGQQVFNLVSKGLLNKRYYSLATNSSFMDYYSKQGVENIYIFNNKDNYIKAVSFDY